jgi:hypothetical protein
MILKVQVGEINMENDVVPAILFIGEVVKVSTKIMTELEPEPGEDAEVQTASVMLLGTVLDSDCMYLTLGVIDEEGESHPKLAIKHADIESIQVYEDDVENMLDPAKAVDGSLIN